MAKTTPQKPAPAATRPATPASPNAARPNPAAMNNPSGIVTRFLDRADAREPIANVQAELERELATMDGPDAHAERKALAEAGKRLSRGESVADVRTWYGERTTPKTDANQPGIDASATGPDVAAAPPASTPTMPNA